RAGCCAPTTRSASCSHARTHAHTHTHTHAHTHIHTNADTYSHIHTHETHALTHTHTHARTHALTHTHTHTHTLCWRSRKGSSISIPPSCTIHQTSMVPSVQGSLLVGKKEMFLGTSRARWAAVVTRTVSERG